MSDDITEEKKEIIERTNNFIKEAVGAQLPPDQVLPHDLVERFEFKFKDKPGKGSQVISNKADKYLVVKQIIIHKYPHENNKIQIVLVMPDPRYIEIVEKTHEGNSVKKVG